MCQGKHSPCCPGVVEHNEFPATAGIEGGLTAGRKSSLISRKDPYFQIVNPFEPKGSIYRWANDPQYRDPSLANFSQF